MARIENQITLKKKHLAQYWLLRVRLPEYNQEAQGRLIANNIPSAYSPGS